MNKIKDVIEQLQDCNLTAWESDFIESISNWSGRLTLRQREVLADLVRRYLDDEAYPEDFE